MRRLKAVVIASFCLLFLTFYGIGWFDTSVSGRVTGTIIGAPTGVSASDNDYNNKVGLNWDTIRGATSYRIFRNTINDSGSATDIGTTARNFFFDSTAVAGQTYFYWVRAENGGSQSAMSTPDQGTRAVGKNTGNGFPPLQPPFAPAGNPITATKAYLGKTLFWDEQLSSTRTVSCGTCHRPASGGADPRSLSTNPASFNPGPDQIFGNADDIIGSMGVPPNNANGTYNYSPFFGVDEQVTGRLAPSYLNAGYSSDGLFWDGRASFEFRDPITNAVVLPMGASLESQSAGPPVSDAEMAHAGRNWTQVAAQIETAKPLALAENIPTALETWIGDRNYPALFEEAFGSPGVTPARIAMAIATHERTLFSDRTPLDKDGMGIQPLQPQENQGRQLFINSDCTFCHNDATLSDQQFHNIGLRPQTDDPGRFGVTGVESDRGEFKTPTLRNVELRGAYMHTGRQSTLAEVIDFYSRGPDFPAPNINGGVIRVRNFNPGERAALEAFMGRPLTDPRVENELPPFDRPTLYSESARVPVVSGTGRTGTGGQQPEVKAVEPPIAGNPSFTVGLSNVIPSTQAVLVINSTDPGVGSTIPAAGSFARQTIQTQNSGGNGFGSVSLAIPATASVIGNTYYGRWYVTDGAAANGFAVSPLFEFTVFGDATAPAGTRFDFDGDSKADISIFRPSVGQWWYLRSSDGLGPAYNFGLQTDVMVPADYTGDGIADVAFFRPSNGRWYVLRSDNTGYYEFPFGTTGDLPAPGDFDGDGIDDPAVFRPSTAEWFILRSSDSQTQFVTFGANGDKPLIGDYDNDGKSDIAIFRPSQSQFWILRSTQGLAAYQFGAPGDNAFAADFSGDGSDDLGLFRPSTGFWYILRSEDVGFYGFPFGTNGDIPAPADYDGDGTADPTVFRPTNTTWYSLQSTNGPTFTGFGLNGDRAIPNSYVVQ